MTQTPAVRIMSFGYRHHGPPAAHIVVNVCEWFYNPANDPAMIEMTGHDGAVVRHVAQTPGVEAFVYELTNVVLSLARLGTGTVTLAVGCAGGRHRSVVIAEWVMDLVHAAGFTAAVTHRDIGKPVIRH